MKLQIFTGGLHTKLRPQYIDVIQGAVYSNIDASKGSLKAVPGKVAANVYTSRFAKYFKGTWLSDSIKRHYAEFNNVLYWTDGINRPKKFNGTSTHNLGIDPPATAPLLIGSEVQSLIEVSMVVATTGNLPARTTYYRFVNFDGEYYSGAMDVIFDLNSSSAVDGVLSSELLDDYGNMLEADALFDGSYMMRTARRAMLELSGATSNKSVAISGVAGIDYGTQGVMVFRQYRGAWHHIGTIIDATSVVNDIVHDISAQPKIEPKTVAPLSGVFQYVYTYYNSATGVESAPSELSDKLSVVGKIEVRNMAVSADPQVDKKRIYRIGGDVSTFTLVTTVANSVTTFTDLIKNKHLVGTLLTTGGYAAPLNTLNFILEANAMMFAASGANVYFTPIGKPDVWPELYYLTFGTDITGLAKTANGILVFTEFSTFIITGTTPSTLSQHLVSNDQGCINSASIQTIGGTAIWASTDGLCASNGGTAEVISKDKLGKLSLVPVDSIVYDEEYYLLQADGNILSLDLAAGIYKNFAINVTAFAIANDILYGWTAGQLYNLFSNDNSPENMHFLSARLVEGRITEDKTYKKVFIFVKGDIILKVLINDVVIIEKALTGTQTHQLQVPQDKQRGNYIQFDITGTGEVYELEYSAGRGHGHD